MPDFKKKILVVGTTGDYIEHISRKLPGRAVFITDPDSVNGRDKLSDSEELIVPLSEGNGFKKNLIHFLDREKYVPSGVVCFDCESLSAAASVAEFFGLPFPSQKTIALCRDKLESKKAWWENAVPCPVTMPVYSRDQLLHSLGETGLSAILKPLNGSGSELTFRCETDEEALRAFNMICSGLRERSDSRMYRKHGTDRQSPDIVCEEFVQGTEYSCDVFFDKKNPCILRLARKYLNPEAPTGTILAYEIPADLPGASSLNELESYLKTIACVMDLDQCLGMVDFIWQDDKPCFLEVTPRLGGDCLPLLVRESCGVDMLEIALDVSEGKIPSMPPPENWERLLGVRFHAEKAGVFKGVNFDEMAWKRMARQFQILKKTDDIIKLPPEDYSSWLIAQGIFKILSGCDTAEALKEIKNGLKMEIR